ncbi:MAG: hypothetical protein QM820_09870 [Minicystis sp.]
MSKDPKHPTFGDMAVDASDVTPVMLTNEQIKQFTKVRPGFAKAVDAVIMLSPEQRQLLGITDADVTQAADLKAQVARIDEVEGPAEELVHRLRSTRIDRCHRIGVILHGAAATARHRADRDPAAAEALGALNDLIAYVSEPGEKAAVTRANKAKAKKASGGTPA